MNAQAAQDALRTLEAAGVEAPVVAVNGRPMRQVTEDALSALDGANDPPELFVRGGQLARVRRDEHARPLIEQVGESALRGVLARAASFVRVTKQGESDVAPPLETVRDVQARPSWTFPALDGVIEAPALRADGTVIDRAGYDPSSRLFYAPSPGASPPRIPEAPDLGERGEALALIREALEGFPFSDEASRANALALMLTPVIRPAIAGQVPLALLDATKAGTGKGLFLSLTALIATGRPAAVLAAPTREEEWAKTILAALARGASIVVLDEAAELHSPALAAALTTPIFEGRILGRSEIARLPQRATWAAAGNNIRLGGDLARRCYWVRLDAKTSRPWQRTGFRHPDLLAWAAERRGDLLRALLIVARGWYAAGKPFAPVAVLGGFEEWSRVVGGMLAFAEVEGFLGNLDALYSQADEEAAGWEAFLSAWHAEHDEEPVSVAQLAEELGEDGQLRETLPDDLAAATAKGAASFKAKLGRALGKRTGTRYGDRELRVERAGQDARSTAFRWQVLTGTEPAGVKGSQGSGTYSYADNGGNFSTADEPHTPANPVPLRRNEAK